MSDVNQNQGDGGSRTAESMAVIPGIQADPLEGFMPARRVIGFSADVRDLAPAGYFGTGTPGYRRAPFKPIEDYRGVGLVDESGYVVRKRYGETGGLNLTAEVFNELTKITSAESRMALYAELKRLGYYGSRDISPAVKTGNAVYDDAEASAFGKFLDNANARGVTWQRMLAEGASSPSAVVSDGPTIRVTSAEDVARALVNEYLIQRGRMPTAAELRAGTVNIQKTERQAVGRGEQMPSLTATSRLQAASGNTAEAGAFAAGMAMNRIFALLGRSSGG